MQIVKPKPKTGLPRPSRGRLLVRREEAQKESEGGILLPDSTQERPCRGTVLAVGGGRFIRKDDAGVDLYGPMVSRAGDVVLFAKYAGSEFEHEGETYLVMPEEDVLAYL